MARWHLLRAAADAASTTTTDAIGDAVRSRVSAAVDAVVVAGGAAAAAELELWPMPLAGGAVLLDVGARDLEEEAERAVAVSWARETKKRARAAMSEALCLLREVEETEASTPWARVMARGRRRAQAILECGRSSCATSTPSSVPGKATPPVSVLRDADGKPTWKRQSCNDRLCKPCQKRVSSERAAYYDDIMARLLADESISDGRLRQVVLSRASSSTIPLREQIRVLWESFREWQRLSNVCGNSIAVVEVTYNADKDWWHPHLHVMTVESDRIVRDAAQVAKGWGPKEKRESWHTHEIAMAGGSVLCCGELERWQELNGYQTGSGYGGLFVNEQKSTKEAMKYVTKGLGMTPLPDSRAIELLRVVDGMHTVRTYGAVRRSAERTPEPALSPDDVDDALLSDPLTGEVYATTQKAADAAGGGVRLCSWTRATSIVEAARSLACSLWPEPPDKGRQQRRRRLALLRSKHKRWKRSAAGKRARLASLDS